MVEIRLGNRKYEVSEEKAKKLKEKYSQKNEREIKEYFLLQQEVLIIGGFLVGYVGGEIINRIIDDIKREDEN